MRQNHFFVKMHPQMSVNAIQGNGIAIVKKLFCRVVLANQFFSHQHFQFFKDAFARSAGPLAFFTTPFILAQKLALRPSSAFVLGFGAGGFRFALFLALYSARPLAVIPAPLSVGL